MTASHPTIVLIGGPNGAGKSTIAPRLIEQVFGFIEFINADVIAAGLSGFHPDGQAFAAGRIMLKRIHRLAELRQDFAFESTLATRSFALFLERLAHQGAQVHLMYIALRSPEIAVKRVVARVAAGGHDVPEETIRRRFTRSIRNLFDLYMPIAAAWTVLDNSHSNGPVTVASGGVDADTIVHAPELWDQLKRSRHDA